MHKTYLASTPLGPYRIGKVGSNFNLVRQTSMFSEPVKVFLQYKLAPWLDLSKLRLISKATQDPESATLNGCDFSGALKGSVSIVAN